MTIQDPKLNLEFTKLNSTISLYTPPLSTSSRENDPTTIIISQWMGASPRSRSINTVYHKYHNLYPSARILTIRSLPSDFTITPTSSRHSHIKEIVAAIQADPEDDRRILVHLFSNGGSLSFSDVCHVYRSSTGKVLPIKAIVLDSSPGQPGLLEGWAALSVGLPKGVLWYPAAGIMWTILLFVWVVSNVLGKQTLVDQPRGWLNDGDLVDGGAKRLYVYSVMDRLVGWRDVERHLEEARGRGVDVVTLREEESPHVQHMVKDEERYWRRVQELWDTTRT